MIYPDILLAEPQDLYPELNESFYSIPLEPKQLIKILNLLYVNGEDELHSNILTFLKDEYSQDFQILFPTSK
jgi:hypothetical protein